MGAWKDTDKGHGYFFGRTSRNTRKYTDKQLDEMVMLKELGRSYDDIGKLFNVSRGTIYNVMKRHGSLPESDLTVVPEGYITIKSYMMEYSESYTTVYWHIRAGNLPSIKINNKIYVPLDTKIKYRGLSEEKISHLLSLAKDTTLSLRAIAKKVGCSYQTVKVYKELLA